MPMEAEELAEMEGLIAIARKREVNFAVCMGKKPEGMIFYMHRIKDHGILARNAKKAGETAKLAWGVAEVKGKKLNLKCVEDPPPNMARTMKMFLKENGLPLKVVLLNFAGDILDTDGDDDDDEEDADNLAAPAGPDMAEQQDTGAAPQDQQPADAADRLADQWEARVGPLGDLFALAMKTNPPNRTQLEALWAMANEKATADQPDYKTALAIADKMEPALKALAETSGDGQQAAPDPQKARYDAIYPALEVLFDKVMEADPPNRDTLEKAWLGMKDEASKGKYENAITVGARLKPALEAALKESEDAAAIDMNDPVAAAWARMETDLSALYLEAMKQNPPDATKLQAAWSMATEKAYTKDYAGAVKIGERLKPLLEAAANPAAASEIPVNVVAFQKSRLLWAKTRETMFSEMKKLENSIASLVASDPDLQDIANSVNALTERLKPFDTQLEDILDAITNEADGEKREALKKEAIAKINAYRNELASDFFQDVDANNGFTNVSVRKAANTSLESIAKVLAG